MLNIKGDYQIGVVDSVKNNEIFNKYNCIY